MPATLPQHVTLEQLMHLLVAMLEHGWGELSVSIVDHHVHAVHPRPTIKNGEEMERFVDILTKSG